MTGERTLSGNFELSLNLTDRRGIRMTGYVYSDDTPDEINARIDRFQDALDRQGIRADIVQKEAQLAGHLQNLELIREGYDMLKTKKDKTGRGLTSQEKAQIDNFEPTTRGAMKAIESLRAAIAEGHKKLSSATPPAK